MKAKYAILLASVVICGIVLMAVLFIVMATKPEEWLQRNRKAAQSHAEAVLSGQRPAIPSTLAASVPWSESDGSTTVYFVLSGGPLSSSGIAYSRTGDAPTKGVAGETRILKWKHLEGNWYNWASD